MESIQSLSISDYIHKINKVEHMLEEIKLGLSLIDKEFKESIVRGEQDIHEGRVTICKNESELNHFLASI